MKEPLAIIVAIMALVIMLSLWLLAALITLGKLSLLGTFLFLIPIPVVVVATILGLIKRKRWARILALVQFWLFFLFGGISNLGQYLGGGPIQHLIIGVILVMTMGWLIFKFSKDCKVRTYFDAYKSLQRSLAVGMSSANENPKAPAMPTTSATEFKR